MMTTPRWSASALALCALTALSACGPGGDVDPATNKFLIYNYDRDTREYRLQRAEIRTLRDVSSVDGSVVYMRGGGLLKSEIEEPKTEAEWEKALIVDGYKTPIIEYTVDSDGTVIPWDFDSAMMLTVYHHMERAAEYFDSIPTDGVPMWPGKSVSAQVGRIPCYYYPQIGVLGISIPLFTDNAAYAYTMNAFLVPPRLALTEAVPIYANRGVITHEYSHAVFNRLVHNGKRAPAHVINEAEWSQTAVNEMNGLDEGVADIFGALDTGDPNYIAPSISEELVDRDMAVARYYETCLRTAVTTGKYPDVTECGGSEVGGKRKDSRGVRMDYEKDGEYDSHHLGAVVGSVFWALRAQLQGQLTDAELGKVVLSALRTISDPSPDFKVAQFFDAMHDHLPAAHQSAACALFRERLPAIEGELQCQP